MANRNVGQFARTDAVGVMVRVMLMVMDDDYIEHLMLGPQKRSAAPPSWDGS